MSDARHYARHIMLKGSVWHFRMVVPLDLRSTIGLSEVHISLGTGYARQAVAKARRLAAAGEEMFNASEGGNRPAWNDANSPG